MPVNHDEITAQLSPLGWEWNRKTSKARYPISEGLGIYLTMADRRDYGRLSASIIVSPRVHVADLANLAADIHAASQTAAHVAEIIVRAYEASHRPQCPARAPHRKNGGA